MYGVRCLGDDEAIIAANAFLGRLGEKLFKDVRGMKRYHRLVNGMMADAASMSGHVFSWLTKAHDSATGPGLTDADSVRESLPGNLSTAYEKLAHKIWSVFPTPDDIRSSQSMQRCTYFQACIKETLRNSPAVARCPYRPVEKGDTIIVDGHDSSRVLRRYKHL
ncbi:hypothetical protein AnigIFM59636_011778 [Aspergillus niger]|nr:hypothetical protein AnigIFM59636_011778 [Aspergillus niger]